MKINASNFVAQEGTDGIINTGSYKSTATGQRDSYPVVAYPFFTGVNVSGTTTAFNVYDVPVGTRMQMSFQFTRQGVSESTDPNCVKKDYNLKKTFTFSKNYTNREGGGGGG